MPTTKFDYLIVGQGLAGTILAHSLITQGHKVMVVDNAHHGSSSRVAAGIINPITGPRLVQSDDFKAYYDYAKAYYAKLEYHIKQTVFSVVEQVRQIQNDEQLKSLDKRRSDSNYAKTIERINETSASQLKNNGYPKVAINGTAIVNTKALLMASKQWLASLHSLDESEFTYKDLVVNDNGVVYKDIVASKIIFCEGFQAIENPWLAHLPFKLAKGEILTLKNDLSQSTMLSWDKWLVPQGKTAKLGSNFAWDDLSLTSSNETKDMLFNSLTENTDITPELIEHEVGIRPSTRQREPLIGPLSTIKNAYCFNGFGSKGCLLIPFYADLLVKHLDQQTPLPERLSKWL